MNVQLFPCGLQFYLHLAKNHTNLPPLFFLKETMKVNSCVNQNLQHSNSGFAVSFKHNLFFLKIFLSTRICFVKFFGRKSLKMFSNIQFKYSWRPYQKDVLENIQAHLRDAKLHVIAPPGSGKTVLGLEVIRQLNQPALVFSPTRTIKNQWIQRFVALFANGDKSLTSLDLLSPKTLTSSTYQSLHSLTLKKEMIKEADNEFVQHNTATNSSKSAAQIIKENNIKTIVLDEAHHLKLEWWKSLTAMLLELEDITLVSLTATPPVDTTALEWERYISLCGPIDAEIAIPELVKENNLCPHQDYIYSSLPTLEETSKINDYYDLAHSWKETILSDAYILEKINRHPVVQNPQNYEDTIYSNIEYYSAIVIYLHYHKSTGFSSLLHILGFSRRKIPPIDDEWTEVLFSNILFKDDFFTNEEYFKSLRHKLTQAGLVERKKLALSRNENITRLLRNSLSKFESIAKIVESEYTSLKKDLRLVILSDFIRKEYFNANQFNKFGVVPIFQYLLQNLSVASKELQNHIAILCGSLSVIPKSCLPFLEEYCQANNLYPKSFQTRELAFVKNHYEIIATTQHKKHIVSLITQLLAQGKINIVIGTKSLLGEGWDCPQINSLIMASFVGSYVLSNQMRGRAIRSDQGNLNKTSNIWHLMCIDRLHTKNNEDYNILSRRFDAFIGLSMEGTEITNGIERLVGSRFAIENFNIDIFNSSTIESSHDRQGLQSRWQEAVASNSKAKLVREVKIKKPKLKRQVYFFNTIKMLFIQIVGTALSFGFDVFFDGLRFLYKHKLLSIESLKNLAFLIGILIIIVFAKPTLNAMVLLFKNGPVAGSFHQIANSVLQTLIHLKRIGNHKNCKINSKTVAGGITLTLENVSPYEQSLFLISVMEILNPIKSPRYVVTRNGAWLQKSIDYHAVPKIFATNKKEAMAFLTYWEKNMGKSRLYYTRNFKGRKILIKARVEALSSAFRNNTKIIESWKH